MNDEYKEKVKNKYYREIYLTKIRIIERAPKLSQEEIKRFPALDYSDNRPYIFVIL